MAFPKAVSCFLWLNFTDLDENSVLQKWKMVTGILLEILGTFSFEWKVLNIGLLQHIILLPPNIEEDDLMNEIRFLEEKLVL